MRRRRGRRRTKNEVEVPEALVEVQVLEAKVEVPKAKVEVEVSDLELEPELGAEQQFEAEAEPLP